MGDKETLDMVVIRREDRKKFDRRRVLCDPDNHRELIAHMRAIARHEDDRNRRDNWLSEYEAEIYRAGKDVLEFRLSALGDDEDR